MVCFSPNINKGAKYVSFDFRWGADCAGLDGHVYVVGGSDDTSRLHSVERYDTSRDQWSPVPPMSTARNGVGVTAVGGKSSCYVNWLYNVLHPKMCPLSMVLLLR